MDAGLELAGGVPFKGGGFLLLAAGGGARAKKMREYQGRYLQADPLGLIDGASVYGYAAQSPLRYTDPTGEAICGGACIAAALWAGGMLLDYSLDDGCYTETDLALSAALNAPWMKGYKALRVVSNAGKARKVAKARKGDPFTPSTLHTRGAANTSPDWPLRKNLNKRALIIQPNGDVL